jgi:hypothetical protein
MAAAVPQHWRKPHYSDIARLGVATANRMPDFAVVDPLDGCLSSKMTTGWP